MARTFHFRNIAFALAALVAPLVHCDIPVHCVQPEVAGLWRFHVGTFEGKNGLDSQCGYIAPDGIDVHHQLTPPHTKKNPEAGNYYLTDKFKKSFSLEVLLRDWNSRVISVDAAGKQHMSEDVEKMGEGQWTMIYDEGFHVNVGTGKDSQHSFLAFSKYALSKGDTGGSTDNMANKLHSHCGNTLLGWYRQIDPQTGAIKKQQCWWGERIKSLHEALATLPPALAGPKAFAPPVLPVPSNASLLQPPKKRSHKASDTDSSSGGPPLGAGLRGNTPEDEGGKPMQATLMSAESVVEAGGHNHLFKRCMQALLVMSLTLTVVSVWTSARVSQKGQFNSWHAAAIVSGIISCGIIGLLWFGESAEEPHRSVPLLIPGPVATHRRVAGRNTTVSEAADRLHEDLQEARQKGAAVHWQSNPEKFKKWLRERRDKHGMKIHESSTVQELLDAISPPRHQWGMGFATDQVIGPVRAVAIKEQMEIAKKMGKSPSELTTEDVKDGWTTSDTNHHKQRTFTMNGKMLEPEGWQTLPDFDWRNVSLQMPGGKSITNFLPAVPDQGGCGSCYAVAATSMLTSRLMLKYPELHEKFAAARGRDRISVEQQLQCNQFNQGCDGGYPYLISAWSFANDLVSKKCMTETGKHTNNTQSCPREFKGESCNERFRVSKWGYVGGALGRCGLHHLCEDAMREELYKGGPLAVSVEPTTGFGYSEGVYHGVAGMEDKNLLAEIPKKDNADCKGNECYIWRKVDHSVLLVGWGEDLTNGKTCQQRVHRTAETQAMPDAGCEKIQNQQDCEKRATCVYRGFPYWIIQNSYGPGFGREGYLYFGPRGQDPMRVEAMTLAADVEWVNRPTSDKPALRPRSLLHAKAAETPSKLLQTSSVLSPAKEHRPFTHIKHSA